MTVEHVQTKREIEEVLTQRGVRPRKRFGQHFLIDGNLMRRLAESAEISPRDWVLEVGGGTGGLTDLLAARAARVVCVEIDDDLVTILGERFGDHPNVRLLHVDVLDGKHRIAPAVVEAIQSVDDGVDAKLVANLPYDVATPLLMNLLVDYPRIRRFCYTVQAEVGERIMAPPGCKAYGPLAILVQTMCVVQLIARLGPSSFWPRPEVGSVMLRVDRMEPGVLMGDEAKSFATFVHGMFLHRRKTLRSALDYALDEASGRRVGEVADLSLRPEQVPVEGWLRMFRVLGQRG